MTHRSIVHSCVCEREQVVSARPVLCANVMEKVWIIKWRGVSYPGLQLRGELGLELAHGAICVISLDEDFGSDGRLLPHVLQAVSLWKQDVTVLEINALSRYVVELTEGKQAIPRRTYVCHNLYELDWTLVVWVSSWTKLFYLQHAVSPCCNRAGCLISPHELRSLTGIFTGTFWHLSRKKKKTGVRRQATQLIFLSGFIKLINCTLISFIACNNIICGFSFILLLHTVFLKLLFLDVLLCMTQVQHSKVFNLHCLFVVNMIIY